MPGNEKLDVICRGSAELTIVAVHGIQGTRASWQPVADALGDEVRWVLPNLRGRAAAYRGVGSADYTLEKFAEDIVAVIAQHVSMPEAGKPNYVLAGWSMGVSVSLAVYAQLKARGMPVPRGLILMSGSPVLQQTSWFNETGHSALLQEIAAREQRLALVNPADRDAVAWTWQAIRYSDQRTLLPTIDVPALIVHGSADEDSPWTHAQLLAHSLPHGQLRTIDGGAHSILTQNTARVAEEMRAFLSNF